MVMGSAHGFSYKLMCRLRNGESQTGLKVRPCFQREKRERGKGRERDENGRRGRRRKGGGERTNPPGHLPVDS